MDSKITTIVKGAIIIALGVLVAIFGGAAVADTYFGVVFLVVGLAMIALGVVAIAKKLPFPVATVVSGAVLVLLSIGLFTSNLSFAPLINFFVWIIMGAGAGLILTGIYFTIRGAIFNGVGQIVIGLVAIILGVLFITVPEFRQAFWIIVGILIAVYGLLVLISAFSKKKLR